jgi:hypothetical protein
MGGAAASRAGLPGHDGLIQLASRGIIRIDGEGAIHRLFRFGPLFLAGQSCREVDPGDDIGGRGLNCGAKESFGASRVAAAGCKIAQLILGLCQVGIQPDGLLQFGLFAGIVVQPIERFRQFVMEQRLVGVGCNRVTIGSGGLQRCGSRFGEVTLPALCVGCGSEEP